MSNYFHIFKILLKNRKKIFLTSGCKPIRIGSDLYLPHSGLSLEDMSFNNLGKVKIQVKGIFHSKGISLSDNLDSAIFDIYKTYEDISIKHIVSTYCTEILKNKMHFEITLHGIAHKLNKNIASCYSKNCRASFGDEKCGVNIENYKEKYNVTCIKGNIAYLEDMEKPDNYYKLSYAQTDKGAKFMVASNIGNEVIFYKNLSENVKFFYLSPTCDKEHKTCCEKFGNSANYRGEPFLPEAPKYIDQ